jgi:Ca2+-binding RTX toxin-like protein
MGTTVISPHALGYRAVALVIAAVFLIAAAPAVAAPANDNFADAQVPNTGESNPTFGSNVDATKELGEPDHAGNPGGASVWYRWTAPTSGTAAVDTCDSGFDTLLGVYTGGSVSSLVQVAGNDDGCIGGFGSSVEFDAEAGAVYQIAVDGFDAQAGDFDLYVVPPASVPPPTQPPPPPAQCADGQDNDGDGKLDGADPGCSGQTDNDEVDPAPPPNTPTAGDDALDGTAGNDRICGLAGADVIRGLAGADTLFGDRCGGTTAAGDGEDRVIGGAGNDKLYGSGAADELKGNAGNDRLDGGTGRDKLEGGGGHDALKGGAGQDALKGGPGRDRISAKDGKRDRVDCGPGRDVVRADRKDRLRRCERTRR